MYELGMGPHAF